MFLAKPPQALSVNPGCLKYISDINSYSDHKNLFIDFIFLYFLKQNRTY